MSLPTLDAGSEPQHADQCECPSKNARLQQPAFVFWPTATSPQWSHISTKTLRTSIRRTFPPLYTDQGTTLECAPSHLGTVPQGTVPQGTAPIGKGRSAGRVRTWRCRKAHANAPVSDVSCCWPGLYVLCDGRRRASGLPYATSWDSADDTQISVVPHSDFKNMI